MKVEGKNAEIVGRAYEAFELQPHPPLAERGESPGRPLHFLVMELVAVIGPDREGAAAESQSSGTPASTLLLASRNSP